MDTRLSFDDKGRLVLPKAMREALGVDRNRFVFATETEDGVLISTKRRNTEELQAMFKGRPSMSKELLKERRQQAKKEGL